MYFIAFYHNDFTSYILTAKYFSFCAHTVFTCLKCCIISKCVTSLVCHGSEIVVDRFEKNRYIAKEDEWFPITSLDSKVQEGINPWKKIPKYQGNLLKLLGVAQWPDVAAGIYLYYKIQIHGSNL